MKYSLSDIIKDLLAKIPVLENRINTLSKKITVLSQNAFNINATENQLKSRLDGNEFVKSKNGENNIALKYEQKDGEDKKTLHAYVDGVEVPLGSQDGSINYEFLGNQNLRCTILANISDIKDVSANGITLYDTTAHGLKFSVEGGDQYALYMYKNNKKYIFMKTDDASFFRHEYTDNVPIPIYQTTVHDIVGGHPFRIITKMSYSKEDVELWISNFLLSKGYNEPIDFIWYGI